jgi:hypothetical protein
VANHNAATPQSNRVALAGQIRDDRDANTHCLVEVHSHDL